MSSSEKRPDDAPGDDALTQEVESPPAPRRRPKRKIALWLLAFAGLGVAGAYAWALHERAAELEADRDDLRDALELHRGTIADLDTELTECESSEEEVRVERDRHGVELADCRRSLEELRDERSEARERLGQFEALTDRFQGMIDTGQLDVVLRRGEMVVELPAAILFPSGSDELSEGGRGALESVADILSSMSERRFTVAGHTDNVPVGDVPFDSNWDLSASRAIAVIEELTEHGVDPRSLAAAGYSQYAPIAPNRTPRGRQANRRIEIILEPDLGPVFEEAEL